MRDKHVASGIVALLLVALVLASCSNAPATTTTSSTTAVSTAPTTVYSWGVVGFGVPGAAKKAGLQFNVPKTVSGITGSVVEIATSNSDSYALTSTGVVWAWGAGSQGEAGDGKTTNLVKTPVEVKFPAGVVIASLPDPMPFNTGMAIDTHGNVWGWGYNQHDELCMKSSASLLPMKLPLSDVTLATGAGGHALFYSHGKVYACGINSDGELGNGKTTNASVPTAVVGLPKGPVKSLLSSWQGSGALMANGVYYDWGFGQTGQLGDGHATNSSVPVKVPLPEPVTQVSQGGLSQANGQTLAILSNRSVWAWGNGKFGQLGTGKRTNALSPIRVVVPAGVTFTQVNAGGATSYAIDSGGKLWAWGQNNLGQVGDAGRRTKELAPVPIAITLTQVSSTANNVAGYFKR
jgi:alpha-tubulin suppressor-like RCC1 family protein